MLSIFDLYNCKCIGNIRFKQSFPIYCFWYKHSPATHSGYDTRIFPFHLPVMPSEGSSSSSPLSEQQLQNYRLLEGSAMVRGPALLQGDEMSNGSRISSLCHPIIEPQNNNI